MKVGLSRFCRSCLGAATVALALGLAAGDAHATDVRFTVAAYSQKTGPYFEKLAEEFHKANPDVTIKIEVIPWETLFQRLTTDIAGGTPPDLAIIGTRWLTDFSAQGIAAPLDSYMTPEFKARFAGSFLAPSTIDGKIMGLPVAASVRAMMINMDIMKKAGAEVPSTWDEVYAAAKKIKENTQYAGFGLQGKGIETDAYYYYALWTFGGDIFTPDGKSALGEKPAIDAAAFYKKMIDEGLTEETPTNYSQTDLFNLFKQGRVAMVCTYPMLVPQVKAEAPNMHYEVVPMPTGAAKATYGVTDTLMLFEASKVKDAAWKFIEYAYQDKERAAFDEAEGFLPVLKKVAALDYYKQNPDIKAFADGLPNAKFAPSVPNWEQMADAITRHLQAIYLGQATPADGMKAAASELDSIIAQQ